MTRGGDFGRGSTEQGRNSCPILVSSFAAFAASLTLIRA